MPLDRTLPGPPWAAAIVGDRRQDIDTFLAGVVQRQVGAGRRVGGCLMHRPPRAPGAPAEMVMVDVETRESYLVSEPLGPQAQACRASAQGFARASAIFRRVHGRGLDLVVCNRFGDLEVRGEGFRAELLDLMSQGLPLLTTVADRNRAAWEEFTGGGAVLPPDVAAVDRWIEAALGRPREAPGRP